MARMKSARRSEALGHEPNYPDIYSDAPGASVHSTVRGAAGSASNAEMRRYGKRAFGPLCIILSKGIQKC